MVALPPARKLKTSPCLLASPLQGYTESHHDRAQVQTLRAMWLDTLQKFCPPQ